MKLFTFQSSSVLRKIIENEDYFASKFLAREQHDYSEDIKQLGGHIPIWCFKSTNDRDFIKEDFIDGSLFHRFTCEMRLRSPEEISDFLLLELDVADDMPKVGITHNSYEGAVVIPMISSKHLIAVYKLEYNDDHKTLWYYPKVSIVELYGSNPLFPYSFTCRKQHKTSAIIECDCGNNYYFDLGSPCVPDTLCKCFKCNKHYMAFSTMGDGDDWYTEYTEVDPTLLDKLLNNDSIPKILLKEEDLI